MPRPFEHPPQIARMPAPHATPAPPPRAPSASAGGVLIQGERFSFHYRAAADLLPGVEAIPVDSFPELTARLEADVPQLGLMAIENSVAGALLTNYLLIEEHGLQIHGEVYLRVSHNLLACPGATLSGLRRVESHPMALRQCRRLFRERTHLSPVEAYDTAGSAMRVAELGDPTLGALAPIWCAEALGLEVLAKAVEDNPHNWTRFVLVRHGSSNSPAPLPGAAVKSSVAFSVAHESGTLARALTRLADIGTSLTKLQSLPAIGSPWEYRFFADYLLPEGRTSEEVLSLLAECTLRLTHLGTYPVGQHVDPS